MAIMITDRQKSVLGFIRDYYAANSYPPSVQEIASDQDVVCNTIQGHIESLERKCLITKQPGKARSILLTKAGRNALV